MKEELEMTTIQITRKLHAKLVFLKSKNKKVLISEVIEERFECICDSEKAPNHA